MIRRLSGAAANTRVQLSGRIAAGPTSAAVRVLGRTTNTFSDHTAVKAAFNLPD